MAFSVWNFVRSYLSIIQIASVVSKRRKQQTKQLKSSWWPKMICGIFCTENDQIVNYKDSPVCTEISDHFFNLQLFDLNEIYFTVNKFKLTLIYASFDSGYGI